MGLSNLRRIPQEHVDCIIQFINEKRAEPKMCETYVNQILREDILTLLDSYCIVVYFPIEDESNNGFHMERGNTHFVYINTNQTKEKQIFTAAHELGHIWGLDQYIRSHLNISVDDETCEQYMNRFAAELLMPMDLCKKFIQRKIKEYPQEESPQKERTMLFGDLIRVVAAVMNEYFVPYKAVVRRMFELNIIPDFTAALLLDSSSMLSPLRIEEFLRSVAQEAGYSRLFQMEPKRWIVGLQEMLDKAAEEKSMPSKRIESIRKQFELISPVADDGLLQSLSLQEEKGGDVGG